MMRTLLRRFALPFTLLCFALLAAAQPITKEQKDEVLKELEKIMLERAFVPGVDFSKWPEHLAKRREDIDKAEDQPSFVSAVNRSLRDFGVSHINLRTPRARESRRTNQTIGVGLMCIKTDGGLLVRGTFPKSPADEAGIKEGEVIIEVDGKAPESPAVLNGEEGTEVSVKVKGVDGATRELKLPRKKFSTLRQDTLTFVGDDAAVLKINSFSNGYDRKLIEGFVADAKAKAKYLVLDLRNNGGGAVANLRHLLSLLLPEGAEIGTFVSRYTAKTYKEEKGEDTADLVELAKFAKARFTAGKADTKFEGKVAVLINGRSGSASEIAAAALREKLKAPLIGSKSAGAVLASVYGNLPYQFECQYPVQDYVTIEGVRLEKNPLTPDIEVPNPRAGEPDTAIEKAIAKLRSG